MRNFFSIVVFFSTLFVSAQNNVPEIDFDSPDSLYREDQFYIGISYINLQNAPQSFEQLKISPNIFFGFLRDIPINKSRTWAIGAGLGYRISVMNHNLGIVENDNSNSYFILTTEFDKNRLTLHYIDLPVEIRWRASTPESHKFWRIYTGLKLGYLVYDHYAFNGSGVDIKEKGNPDLDKLEYGAYLSAGWNTWNVYLYYGLNPIFKSATIDDNRIKMNNFNIGLMFYIL